MILYPGGKSSVYCTFAMHKFSLHSHVCMRLPYILYAPGAGKGGLGDGLLRGGGEVTFAAVAEFTRNPAAKTTAMAR